MKNRNKFIKFLEIYDIKFKQLDEKIIIYGDHIYLSFLKSLPEGITFNNGGNIVLNFLESLPKGITFNNGRNIELSSLESLPEDVTFNNGGYVDLNSLTSLPKDVTFSNGGDISLRFLTSLDKDVSFNNGGNVYLSSLTSLPEDFTFNNGGYVHLKSKVLTNTKNYITKFKIKVEDKDNSIVLYKKVSYDFKTQENTENETLWKIGSKVIHPDWQPELKECGEGKFHACAHPHWCDVFRDKKGDRYIAIKVLINDLHEWKNNPYYAQKIGFRKGVVLYECDRNGNKIN